uniref:Uncharacterized protein n=1 Tax=Anguilla anguilla TaxID=7936 RepID=A0A0E9SK35_ANGAN
MTVSADGGMLTTGFTGCQPE